jgi:hypothetical protein
LHNYESIELYRVFHYGALPDRDDFVGWRLLFGGFAVTGANLSAARTRGALTHPITTGIFLWSICSTLLTLASRHPLAGAAVVGCGVFFVLVVLLMFHQKIIWADLTWYCATACVLFCMSDLSKQ